MSRNRHRPTRTLAGVAGAVALTGLLLSGCGAGQISQTAQQVAATNGLNASVGQVDLLDVQIAYPENPAGPNALYNPGESAPVRATLVNNGAVADRLVSVSSADAASVAIGGETALPEGVALVAVGNSQLQPTASRPLELTLEGLSRPVAPGTDVEMTFVFERAGSVTVTVPTAIPEQNAAAGPPERDDFHAEAETGGAEQPPPPGPPADGEGAEVAPGNEESGSGGAAGN
ncbi:copper chaperone PCu(A)C [Pseudonocardia nematodicida]|uniref:Copper chaperone PCu(A)C n=1 Tax=Pseudonocardia nematodicida TaxID=1206997 RepID=A0ABV1KBW8_9PSEU